MKPIDDRMVPHVPEINRIVCALVQEPQAQGKIANPQVCGIGLVNHPVYLQGRIPLVSTELSNLPADNFFQAGRKLPPREFKLLGSYHFCWFHAGSFF